MRSEDIQHEGAAPSGSAGAARPRYSRRQMLGRVSTGAAVGAAAWVVPEILTAKPAAGATLSGAGGTGGAGGGGGGGAVSTSPSTTGSTSAPSTAGSTTGENGTSGSLAMTGVDIKRDAEIGAAMVAGGWAMHKWASRTPKVAGAGAHVRGAHVKTGEAGSPADTA
jgi:hypothetical protein